MKGNRRPLNAIILLVLGVLLLAGYCWWLWGASHHRQQHAETPRTSETRDTGKEDAAKIRLAVSFEHAMRDWGVDPTVEPSTFAMKPASDVLDALRTPVLGESPLKGMIGFEPGKDTGPESMSYVCRTGYEPYCTDTPKTQDWWRSEVWGMGSRWKGEPSATVLPDGTVEVTGTVRAIMVTSGDRFTLNGYSALTPAWSDYMIDDILTVKGGKIGKLEHKALDYWWTDPWLADWTPDNVASNIGAGERVAIPVQGGLDWRGFEPSGMVQALDAPITQADLDGRVKWTLWDKVPLPGSDPIR